MVSNSRRIADYIMFARSMKILMLSTFAASASLMLSSCCDKTEAAKARKDLYSASAKVRNDAALVLAQCGADEGGIAVPRLIELMYDQNVGVQSSAAYALRKIDTKEARAALDKATKRR